MNTVVLMGRLVRDPDVRPSGTDAGLRIARYALAVERRSAGGRERQTDFIQCVAFGKNAGFAENYLKQGMKVMVSGRMQTGRFVRPDGTKTHTTDVVVESCDFAEDLKKAPESGLPRMMATVLMTKSLASAEWQFVEDFATIEEAYRYAEKVMSNPRNMKMTLIIEEFHGERMRTIALTPEGRKVALN